MGAFFDMINEFYKYRNLKVIEVLRPHFPTVNLRNQRGKGTCNICHITIKWL